MQGGYLSFGQRHLLGGRLDIAVAITTETQSGFLP
jgi:hypothetical protein